jgi:hypothetical protein
MARYNINKNGKIQYKQKWQDTISVHCLFVNYFSFRDVLQAALKYPVGCSLLDRTIENIEMAQSNMRKLNYYYLPIVFE